MLHDASEAYIADITRPIKPYLTNHAEIEERLQSLIYHKFIAKPLSLEELSQVQQIDDNLLICEFNALMRKSAFDSQPKMSGNLSFKLASFDSVERQYFKIWADLTGQKTENSFPDHRFISVGIDGCKGKWLAVAISNIGQEVTLFDTIEEVCSCYQNVDSILIDMPLGLAESEKDIRPDAELRICLSGKASSVFNAPCRQAVYESDYPNASNVNFKIMGKKLSKQSFAIIPKIRELNSFLQNHPEWKNRILESHPEYCFSLLNAGSPIIENKQTAAGAMKRLNLLSKYYPECNELLKMFKSQYPALSAKTDDLLDALALAVIGGIGLKTGFHSIPKRPFKDARAIKMQIIGADLT